MDTYRIIGFALIAVLYSGFRLYSAFQSRHSKIILGIAYALILLTIGYVYQDITTVFADGFGRSNLRTNWLMGIGFGLVLGLGALTIWLLLIDGYALIRTGLGKVVQQLKWQPNYSSENSGRRRVLRQLGLGIAALPFAGIMYGMWRGKYNFQVRRLALTFPDLPAAFDGFRLLQFSDVHSGSYDDFEAVRQGVDLMAKEKADAIVFTGDWINNFADEIDPYTPLFSALEAPCGKYAVLGNHDYSELEEWETRSSYENNLRQLKHKIDEMGFRQLNNDNVLIQKDGEQIRLVGVENWGHPPFPQRGDLQLAISGCRDDEFTILLSHDPTHWEEVVLPHPKHFHLTLSGHTHGSQIGIENSWFKWAPIQYAYERWAGLYQEAKQFLYVNRGLGFIGYAGRLGIPPEITVITLNRG